MATGILVQSELGVFLDFASSFFKSSRHLNLKFHLCSKIQNDLKKTGLQCKFSNLQEEPLPYSFADEYKDAIKKLKVLVQLQG